MFKKLRFAWQAYKNAERLKYRLIWDLDWGIEIPPGGDASGFLDGLNKFVKVEVRAISHRGEELRTAQPFLHRVGALEVISALR